MSTITQVLSALPTAPARSQTPTAFVASADAFIGGFALLQTQQNALTGQINTVAGEIASGVVTSNQNAVVSATAIAAIAAQSPIANAASAAASASIATAAALSAASVLQQDLSAFTGALHRSPNAVVAQFIYDTSKDSDGGAWIDRMQDKSWANEPLNGAWRGQQASEAACRAISGAATGDYFQLTTDGKFYKLNAGSGVTEVFRGNTAKFPRLSAIIAEAGSVTIYDLTAPGRPMWLRFVAGSAIYPDVRSLVMSNGVLVVGCFAYGLVRMSFLADESFIVSIGLPYSAKYSNTIAGRNVGGYLIQDQRYGNVINVNINSVAMTVLPDAPIDIATGLAVPTILVGTIGGASVLKQDGTVSNWLTNVGYITSVAFDKLNGLLATGGASVAYASWYKKVVPTATTDNTFDYSFDEASTPRRVGTNGNNGAINALATSGRSKLLAASVFPVVQVLTDNPSTPTKGMVANITNTYNTGHMVGDIRRCYLSDVSAGTVSNPSTVADRSYKAAAATVYGTLTKTAVGTGSQLVAYSGFGAANYIQEPYSADLDFGTGDFSISVWVNSGNAFLKIASRNGADFYVVGTNQVSFGVPPNNAYTLSGSNTGWQFLVLSVSQANGTAKIYRNGVYLADLVGPAGAVATAASIFVGGSSPPLQVGKDSAGGAAIALLRVSATLPSVEQALFAYTQEAAMFKDGAQVALPDAGAVQDLAYDDQQDKWVAVSTANESSFTGLVRTATAAASSGAFAKASARSGVKILSRYGSADVTLPAYGLREELIRRAEAAAKQSKTLTVFDFDAIGAQTDFALPIGWRTTEVLSAGASKREGATKDWIRKYDGFRETISFATAPGAAVWVQLTAKRE